MPPTDNSRTDPSASRFLQAVAKNREMLRCLPSAPPRLVVIGNFNAGKSTLINALLGKRLLPAALKPTTGAVIRIVWSAEERTTVRFLDGRMKSAPGTALLEEYAVIGAPGNSERVEDIQLETDSPFLAGDLMVVDVPGMEDDPGRYAAIFREVMPADVVLSVHDVGVQMPLSETTFLQAELVENGCAAITIIWNKCNLIEEGVQQEAAVAGAVARLKGVKQQPLEPLRAWYRLDALPELRKRLAGESPSASFQTFQDDIKDALNPDSLLLKQTRATRIATLLAAQAEADPEPELSGASQLPTWRERVHAITESLIATAARLKMEAQTANLTQLAQSIAERRGNLLIQIRQAADEAAHLSQYLEQSLIAVVTDTRQIRQDYDLVRNCFEEARLRQAELPDLIGQYRRELQVSLLRSFLVRIQAIRQYLPDPASLPSTLSPQAMSQILNAHVQAPMEAWRQNRISPNSAYQILLPIVARLSDDVHAEIIRMLGLVTEIRGAPPEAGLAESSPETRRAVGRVVSSVSLRLIDQEALLSLFLARLPTLDPSRLTAFRGATRDDLLPQIESLLMTLLAESEAQIDTGVESVLQSVEKKITATTANALASIEKRWEELVSPAQVEESRNKELLQAALKQNQHNIETLNEIYYNFQAAITTFLPLK